MPPRQNLACLLLVSLLAACGGPIAPSSGAGNARMTPNAERTVSASTPANAFDPTPKIERTAPPATPISIFDLSGADPRLEPLRTTQSITITDNNSPFYAAYSPSVAKFTLSRIGDGF